MFHSSAPDFYRTKQDACFEYSYYNLRECFSDLLREIRSAGETVDLSTTLSPGLFTCANCRKVIFSPIVLSQRDVPTHCTSCGERYTRNQDGVLIPVLRLSTAEEIRSLNENDKLQLGRACGRFIEDTKGIW